MELVTLRRQASPRLSTVAGRVDGDIVEVLDAASVREVLADPSVLERPTGERLALADVDLAPVVPCPGKVVCVGLNYRDHIEETGRRAPDHPTYFAKFADALAGPYDDLVLPAPEVSTSIDWEAELAVVIGRPTRNVTRHDALDHIAGFTICNDVSVRDWQRRTSQFLAGKTFEGLSALGPKLVTTDVLGDGCSLDIRTAVNGVVKQDSNTRHLVFDTLDLVADLSTIVTLEPGDIIATGTPGGVGVARTPPEFLAPGDVVDVSIEGIGAIRNRCV